MSKTPLIAVVAGTPATQVCTSFGSTIFLKTSGFIIANGPLIFPFTFTKRRIIFPLVTT